MSFQENVKYAFFGILKKKKNVKYVFSNTAPAPILAITGRGLPVWPLKRCACVCACMLVWHVENCIGLE